MCETCASHADTGVIWEMSSSFGFGDYCPSSLAALRQLSFGTLGGVTSEIAPKLLMSVCFRFTHK